MEVICFFLDKKKICLNIYCEQTSEALCSDVKLINNRFHRNADHPLFGARLLRASASFTSQNM